MMGGQITATDVQAGTCTLDFELGRQFCHSVDIVQGGFVTAMLDAAMSHAVFARDDSVVGLSSLEISTRYLEVARAGALRAVGQIQRLSYKTAFLEGRLLDAEGRLVATAQSVAKVSRRQQDS